MTRVMIVEDDVLFRRTIRSMLNWESLGFSVCGECVHGKDALSHMAEYVPDIVLTDISMPQMNGIELIRALKLDYPMVRIIVLSSYDDFDFVKEAMKLGADDYILKHDLSHSMDQFLRVLEETKAKITDSASEGLLGRTSEKQLILDAFMNRILNGRVRDKKEIEQQLRRLMVYFPFDRYMLAVIAAREALAVMNVESGERAEWQTGDPEVKRFRQAVLDLMDSPASSRRLAFLADDQMGVCIFNVKNIFSQSRMHETVRSALMGLFNSGLNLCIGVSGLFEDVLQLPESYRQACLAAEHGVLYAKQALTFHGDLTDRGLPEGLLSHLNEMRVILGKEDGKAAEAWVQKLTGAVYTARITPSRLKEVCGHVNREFESWAKKQGLEMEDITHSGRIPCELLAVSGSSEVFASYLTGCFERAFSIDKLTPQTANPRIRQAVEYIDSHYREQIGLREVSQALEISENYLSNLFKQETGWHFVEYLNEVRLHRAKRLVANGNLKVYEIARQCGFHSVAYFCRLFKEKTGMSLTKHRKKEAEGQPPREEVWDKTKQS